MQINRSCIPSLMLGLFFLARPAAAQFEQLAASVPGSANAIVLLDGQKLLSSPLAQKEGWKEHYERAFASGLVTISPDTRHMILASQLDYEHMNPLWEVAVADFGTQRTVVDIARRTQGTIDKFGELAAVSLSDNSMCVQLSPTRLGVMAPANRQTVARWVRDIESRKEPALSGYLKGTLAASQSSQIVLAFDLEDAVPPEFIEARLGTSATLAGKNMDMKSAALVISGLRGLVLEVTVTDVSVGRLMVHFSRDASILAPFAKPLLLEVLGNMGAMIDDIAEWKVTTKAQRFTLSGPLSAAGLKRVMSLIDHPTAALIATDASESTSAESDSSKMASATQQYFKAITTIRDDLREMAKDAKTLSQHAMWIDNWARKIDRLPILDVDPEMLAYGAYTTARMRDASSAIKGIGIRSAGREAQVYNTYSANVTGYRGYGGGGYSYYYQSNNVAGQRRAIGAQEKAQGATNAQEIAAEMENETAKIRKAMTQKYQVNF